MTLLLLAASTALADPFGELARFGKEGTGHGQFKLGPSGLSDEVHAFGVDPSDGNAVYVADEQTVGKATEYRIQKLTSKGVFVASASIPVTKASRFKGIQGVAIDPVLKRLYVLTVYERDEKGAEPVDPNVETAGTLYAFSTVASGEKLPPASVANSEGVIASNDALLAQSETRGQAILEPAGIAVDPSTHDVIIAGQSDLGTENEEELEWHTILQRVGTSAAGEVDPMGGRWVDSNNCLNGNEPAESCPPSAEEPPSSPIVSEGGKVFIGETEQLWEIPTAGGKFAAGNPKVLLQFTNPLVTFPVPNPEPHGGSLSFVGEGGGKGKIYSVAGINQEGSPYRGALVFDFAENAGVATAAESGWTGGQSPASPKCSIGLLGKSSIAGGAGNLIFVLDPHHAIDEFSEANEPHVTEFGPEGSSCPHGSATEPSASVLGKEASSAGPSDEVLLSSKVSLANALKVTWRFENTTTKAVSEATSPGEGQLTKVGHKFGAAGTYEVTETIATDNLATPTIVVSRKFTIVASLPLARFPAVAGLTTGEEAKFNASSSEANGSPITKYIWNFGDGSPEVTATLATIGHVYPSAGSFTVTLKVINALGTSAPTTHQIVVSNPSGGGGGGGGGGGEEQPAPPTTSSPSLAPVVVSPPPSGGVLSYKASLATTSVSVGANGSAALKVNCGGASSCKGTVTLKTLSAVSSGASKRKAILTLGSASFSAAGNHVVAVTLHLSVKARALLAKMRTLRVRATIAARDQAGVSHNTVATITLRAAKRGAKH